MKSIYKLLSFCFFFLFVWGNLCSFAFSASPDIEPYVKFLQAMKQSPVDYVMELFKTYDVVILCERDHREITQYEFIFQLVGHPEFMKKVGHVFTEVGSKSQEKRFENFLTSPGLSKLEIEKRLLDIYRNLTWFPIWEKINFSDFLRQVYLLNQKLSHEQMIHIHPSDVSFDWEKGTPEDYMHFRKELDKRDKIMAENVLSGFRDLEKSDSRKKALIIMNYRHAYNDNFAFQGKKSDNTGRYLFEALPGKVANVLINSLGPLPDADDHKVSNTVIQAGKWDAAFEFCGNPNLGFSFQGTPFGKDKFDHFPFIPHEFSYQDIFHGYVFFLPLKDHKVMWGIPGIFDEAFTKEFKRRSAICGRNYSEQDMKNMVESLNSVYESAYEEIEQHRKKILSWLN